MVQWMRDQGRPLFSFFCWPGHRKCISASAKENNACTLSPNNFWPTHFADDKCLRVQVVSIFQCIRGFPFWSLITQRKLPLKFSQSRCSFFFIPKVVFSVKLGTSRTPCQQEGINLYSVTIFTVQYRGCDEEIMFSLIIYRNELII